VCHEYICPAEEGQCPITDLEQDLDNAESELLTADGRRIPILKTVVSVTLAGREHLLESFLDITERKRAEEERERLMRQLQEALAEVKTLSGFLPLCASCKRIRDDEGNRLKRIFETIPRPSSATVCALNLQRSFTRRLLTRRHSPHMGSCSAASTCGSDNGRH
jgi:hypothetical protein